MKNYLRIVLLAFVIGLLILVVGICLHPGLPYLDPTPEMLEQYNEEAAAADPIILIGFIWSAVSVLGIAIGLSARLFRKKEQ